MKVIVDGKALDNFSSNDYLGLSQSPYLKERAIEFTSRYGVGSGASRLVSGNIDIYEQIEEKLARLKGTETSLLLCSGFQTNVTTIAALTAGSHVRAFCDRFSHNSMMQGVMQSGSKWTRFQHNDLEDLKKRLKRDPAREAASKWILTESVFSMDGDCADIDALVQIASDNDANLFVDEAHSTGVLGERGMGLAAGKNVEIVMGTFSKACGSFGGYIACKAVTRDFLVNFCSGLIYSTALPPAVLGAIDAALDLVPKMELQRKTLKEYSNYVRAELNRLHFSSGESKSQIIPVIVGCELDAINLSKFLEDEGILAPAIRPPTVPTNSARVRLSLSAAHTEEQIQRLITVLEKWRDRA
jgi:8-amino-7-oxononanoate synthase